MSKVNIIYWSGTGNTEAMAKLIAEGAQENGAEVKLLNVSDAKEDDVKEADILAFGSPSMGSEVVEEAEMQPFLESVASIVTGKKVALFGSYGWGDGEWMRNWVSEMDDLGADVINDGLIVQEAPSGDTAEQCKSLGRELA